MEKQLPWKKKMYDRLDQTILKAADVCELG